MSWAYPELFEPLTVGSVTLRNRIAVPPMVQRRPLSSPRAVAWYRRLAAGGAGLVTVESTGVGEFGATLDSDDAEWLAGAIHAGGAAAAWQLFPTATSVEGDENSLTAVQLDEIVAGYRKAAAMCVEAGFDGVEPHGAHGFLLNRFFDPAHNERSDEYGGSLENRSRLAVRIVGAVRDAAGDHALLLYRHTPVGEGYGLEDSLWLAERLVEAGLGVLDVSPARDESPADLAAPFARALDLPVIAVGGMEEPKAAAAALRAGRCDLVALGRQMIADARWPQKVREGRPDDIICCSHCDEGCFGNLQRGEPVECVQWNRDELAEYVEPAD